MKRIIVTEGDGKLVRRVARKYPARAFIRTESGNSSIEVMVRPNGEYTVTVQTPEDGWTTVAEGTL